MKPAVEMRGITKRFGPVWANSRIDLSVDRGGLHAVVGENGAGKSTLMHILAGLVRPDEGEVTVAGQQQPVDLRGPRPHVGLVAQNLSLVPALTGWENIVLGREPTRWARLDRRAALDGASRIARDLGLLIPLEMQVSHLPTGTRQIVEITKALYREAQILILDEPTSAISPPEAARLFDLLQNIRNRGVTVILVTHRVSEVVRHATAATVLSRGRVVAEFTRDALSADALVGAIVEGGTSSETKDVLAHGLPGARPEPKAPDLPQLALEALGVEARDGPGIRELSLAVNPGEVLGLAAVAGNGEVELVRAITGQLPASSGRILVRGRDLTRCTIADRRRAGIAVIPEDRGLYGLVSELSLADNLILGDHRLFTSPTGISAGAVARHAEGLVQDFDIRAADAREPVGTLSGGNQQKAVIARELSSSPAVVVAENPFKGLDVAAAAFAQERLLEVRSRGDGVLLLSPDLEELIAVSDRIAVIFQGQIAGIQTSDRFDVEELGRWMTTGATNSSQTPK